MDLTRAEWRTSTRSQSNGQCVEVAILADAVATRDSKNTEGPALTFPLGVWSAFIQGTKDGAFDIS